MLRWLLVLFLALLVLSALSPLLRRLGIGRLPGDLHFRLFGVDCHVPLASTVVLSIVATLIARLIGY
ncbi:MAG: hypothetical protein OJF60_003475 [Burkholderiaceae bacterium]|jgi:hypothetical protein|nr:MAG: hypothetical protein OJF60_003475 [Burkholderiaceae bacterium]